MNTDRILIYGEPLGELRAAIAFLQAADPPDPLDLDEEIQTVVHLGAVLRAVQRAEAELLLQDAASGLPTLDLLPPAHRRLGASICVLREMDAVAADPLVLHSHPLLTQTGHAVGG